MQKIIYFCDRCGKEIAGTVNDFYMRLDHADGTEEIHYDLCDECSTDLLPKIHNVFEDVFPVWKDYEPLSEDEEVLPSDEEPEQVIEDVPVEKTQKSTVKTKRKSIKIDEGKVLALRNAGWSYKKIADEMGVDEKKIANTLYRMKKG